MLVKVEYNEWYNAQNWYFQPTFHRFEACVYWFSMHFAKLSIVSVHEGKKVSSEIWKRHLSGKYKTPQNIVFVCISATSVLHAQNSRISRQRLRCSFNWQFWAVRNANIVHEAELRLWWKRSIRRLIQDINKAGWKPNKHIAQGNTLGRRINNNTTPCKGKSIDN